MPMRYNLLMGGIDDFNGADHQMTHKFVRNDGWPGYVFTNDTRTIDGAMYDLVAIREISHHRQFDEQNINERIDSTGVGMKCGGFVGEKKSFVGDFSPEGYPLLNKCTDECDDKRKKQADANKYLHEIKPGIFIDVYDVLMAWNVTNPALQHLIKKALQAGDRGHKSREQDLQDIIDSAIRAKELESK